MEEPVEPGVVVVVGSRVAGIPGCKVMIMAEDNTTTGRLQICADEVRIGSALCSLSPASETRELSHPISPQKVVDAFTYIGSASVLTAGSLTPISIHMSWTEDYLRCRMDTFGSSWIQCSG